MNQELLDRLQEIQYQQYEAFSTQDIELLIFLESEKTQLLQKLTDFADASNDQLKQLHIILNNQQDLEKVCVEVRDELGKQIKKVMERHKAALAYKEID